jgi:oligopeptidase B
VLVTALDAFKDHLVLWEMEGGLRQIEVRDLGSGEVHAVRFPEPVYACSPQNNLEFDTGLLRFNYQSPVTPPSIVDYDMAKRTWTVKKKTEVPHYTASAYATERTWAHAPDGTAVPISLLYRKGVVRDGTRPCYLYAYGSYGIGTEPRFNSALFSLVDRGYVCAVAHVRGGDEMGRAWYDQGKLLQKKNTFTDFIACAEHLVAQRITSSDRLAIRGGSAGGLLIGAVLNMKPELFRAAVADVPFVDVITTMKDPTIPLTTQEWEQWGDPRDARYYAYMKSYSPYDNVAARAYPAMLVTAGLNDPRVGYWEPTKWVARLRALRTDHNPLLLRVNMGAGHGGASGRYDNLHEQALRYAFIVSALEGRLGPGPAAGAVHP